MNVKMNVSSVTEFVFRDISSHTVKMVLLALVFICYTTVLVGNLLIMVTVRSEPKLFHRPMYFFLTSLSFFDLTLATMASPKLLSNLLNSGSTISYGGCMAQVFTFHLSAGAEMLLLSVMAYDRYVAICHPLRYATIMNRQCCSTLIILCWTGALIHAFFQAVITAQLPLCGPNVLDSFFCDITQVIQLACSDVYVSEVLFVFSNNLITIPCFLTLLVSYATILATLCGHFGKDGRRGLSTCGSHLTVVFLFYGPILVVAANSSNSQVEKMSSVFYAVVTPALNPLVYTLRNKEVMGAMGRLINRCKRFVLPQLN